MHNHHFLPKVCEVCGYILFGLFAGKNGSCSQLKQVSNSKLICSFNEVHGSKISKF